ncbi:MAG: hypothetical protein N2235_09960, partial [Fischerella sp.]|nr:hypothetical protein [Fischerella sp.]
ESISQLPSSSVSRAQQFQTLKLVQQQEIDQQQQQEIEQQQEQQEVEQQELVGRVYSVVGDIVMIELDNRETRHVNIPREERVHMGQILGQRVMINTDPSEWLITWAPSPAPTPIGAINVSEVYRSIMERETTQRVPVVPSPAPEIQPTQPTEPEQPTEQPTPETEIVPQTW